MYTLPFAHFLDVKTTLWKWTMRKGFAWKGFAWKRKRILLGAKGLQNIKLVMPQKFQFLASVAYDKIFFF